MQFLTALVLASSASASLVRRQGTSGSTAAAAGNDVAALFTGFSDAQCTTVNTEEEEVTFEAYDGYCRAIDPALSLTAVDVDVDGTVLYDFWAYTSDDCDPDNAVLIGNDECHAAPAGKPFLSFMMVTEEEEEGEVDGSESGSDSDILVARE